MDTSQEDDEIYISISGKFKVNGPLADYTELLKGACCTIAMDLARGANIKTHYFIAHSLFVNINSPFAIYPKTNNSYLGRITNLQHLSNDKVNVRTFTEYPYTSLNGFSLTNVNRTDSIKYYVDNDSLVKVSYDLTIDVGIFLESKRDKLESKGYKRSTMLKIDDNLIDCLKYLRNKSCGTDFEMRKFRCFLAEMIKTLGGKKLCMTPAILNELNAALERKLKMEINDVE